MPKGVVTRPPRYSTVRQPDGRYVSTYTVEIDGEKITEQFSAADPSAAESGARTRYYKAAANKTGQTSKRALDRQAGIPTKEDSSYDYNSNISGENRTTTEGLSNLSAQVRVDPKALSEEEEKNIKQTSEEEETKSHMVKGRPRNHVPWSSTWFGLGDEIDGVGEEELEEPNPEPFVRPGDNIIRGMNNTMIMLGRDHAPQQSQVYTKSILERNYNSGFSDHMGAGAIDIVAGRMAPFPLEESISGDSIVLGPSFNTSYPPEIADYPLEGGSHPGMVMDAARIYVSQMTAVDENFKISKALTSSRRPSPKVAPTSGIILKADKVRLHARQDIKIVTGGPFEQHNSQGNSIKRNHGIHLIAQNGIDREGNRLYQQPIPLGDNLERCLKSIMKRISDLNQSLDAYVTFQSKLNSHVAKSFEFMPIPGGITAGNPFREVAELVTQIQTLVKTRFDSVKQELNNFNINSSYLDPSSEIYINSKHNTVN